MSDNRTSPKSQARKAREERLAAELRENLRKRKVQGRIRKTAETEAGGPSTNDGGKPPFGGTGAE